MPTDQAIVLRRFPYSESSLVVHVLSRLHGRVHLLARGAYRPKSRYFAVLDLFDTLKLEWKHNPRTELQNLSAGMVLETRRHLTDNLETYKAGLTILELCELGSHQGKPDTALFERSLRCLDALDCGQLHTDLIIAAFELSFLQVHGLAPATRGCASCGLEAPPTHRNTKRAAFSAGAGGRLCPSCAEDARASGRRVGTLPVDVLEIASRLLALEGHLPTPSEATELAGERLVRVRDFVGRFLDYHLQTQPRTHHRFLAVPNRNAPSPARPE